MLLPTRIRIVHSAVRRVVKSRAAPAPALAAPRPSCGPAKAGWDGGTHRRRTATRYVYAWGCGRTNTVHPKRIAPPSPAEFMLVECRLRTACFTPALLGRRRFLPVSQDPFGHGHPTTIISRLRTDRLLLQATTVISNLSRQVYLIGQVETSLACSDPPYSSTQRSIPRDLFAVAYLPKVRTY